MARFCKQKDGALAPPLFALGERPNYCGGRPCELPPPPPPPLPRELPPDGCGADSRPTNAAPNNRRNAVPSSYRKPREYDGYDYEPREYDGYEPCEMREYDGYDRYELREYDGFDPYEPREYDGYEPREFAFVRVAARTRSRLAS